MAFDQKAYSKGYQAEKRTHIKIPVSYDEKALFDKAIQDMDVEISSYLKHLINADFISRGMDPIFYDARKKLKPMI